MEIRGLLWVNVNNYYGFNHFVVICRHGKGGTKLFFDRFLFFENLLYVSTFIFFESETIDSRIVRHVTSFIAI